MSKPASRLGKGLSAILGPRTAGGLVASDDVRAGAPAGAAGGEAPASESIREIPLDAIRRNPRQPRTQFSDSALQELVQSIRAKGVLQPVVVRPTGDGVFELVAGERRWRAARMAGLTTVPAIVRELSDAESLEIALIENLQREDLTPLERARAYQQYITTFRVASDQLADRLGESRSSVVNYLRLLKLRPEIVDLLAAGALEMGHARALLSIADPQRQLAIASLAARRGLSVRQIEEMARRTGEEGAAAPAERKAADGAARHLEEVGRTLSRSLGLPVGISPGKGKNAGRVVIRYRNLEEFDRIAERLGASLD